MFHPALAVRTQAIKAQAVLCLVDFLKKACPQLRPLRRVHFTFEHGVLHALA